MGAHGLESKTNYTFVGIAVLILVVGLLCGVIWLSTGFDTKSYDLYTVYVDEAVSGLAEDAIVKFNGVKVGMVNKIELDQLDPQEVKLQLKIVQGTPITITTHASLISQGITGAVYLGLSATSPSLLPLEKTPGEPYPIIPYKPSFFSQLEQTIDEVSVGFKRIFDKGNAKAIKKTLANIEAITGIFAQNKEDLNKTLKELPALVARLKAGVEQFSQMSSDMSVAGKQVSTTMRSGKVTIDKISQQALPPMVLLLQRLDTIAANLEQVSSQMRQNPAVIIRGTAPPEAGPGE
jgi:phospholipid/cholesterol/gamma-HCH transport system substrate-binding protein